MSFEVGHNMNFTLPTDWKWFELVELQANEKRPIISGPFGSSIGSRFFQPKGVPVIRGNNLSLNISDRFIDDGFVFLSEAKANELNTWATKDDILFTAAGTIGQVGLIEENTRFLSYIISNKQIRVRFDYLKILPRYAYYWLSQPLMIEFIQQRNTGSTIPLINLSVVKSLPIALPPINVQRKIVAILSSLDNKIELNRQTNQTLEAIAHALFKEWFFDFNFPGATGEMEKSELGEIPKGWKIGKLFDISKLIGGGTPKTSINEYWENGTIQWISAKDVTPNNGTFITDTEKKITKLGLLKSSAKLLPQYSTVITARGTVGNYCIIPETMAISQSNYALSSTLNNGQFFLFYIIANLVTELKQRSYGTVFDTITTNSLTDIQIVIPEQNVLDKYNKIITPIFENILNNLKQTKTLTQLRDSLLPKLMKGELIK